MFHYTLIHSYIKFIHVLFCVFRFTKKLKLKTFGILMTSFYSTNQNLKRMMKSKAENVYYILVKLIRLLRICTHLSRKNFRKYVNVHFFIQNISKNLMFKKCLLKIELGGPFGGHGLPPVMNVPILQIFFL